MIHGHLTVADQLLNAKADPGLVVNLKPEDLPLPIQVVLIDVWGNWTPLHFSILYQRREIMTRLLEAKAPFSAGGPSVASHKTTSIDGYGNDRTKTWQFEATPLILSVWLNDMVACQTLLDHGADINQAASEDGETPLLAAVWERPGLVPLLLEKGARLPDGPALGRSILHWAIDRYDPPVIRRLIKEGADVNARVVNNENSHEGNPTPLEHVLVQWFANKEREGEVREGLTDALTEAGAKPTVRALMSAASRNYIRFVRAFIEAGVDPNGRNEDGFRALHWVSHVETAKVLIDSGARLGAKNHAGVTPFGNVISKQDDNADSRALIDYFLEMGADPSVIPTLLLQDQFTFGDRPLLPYVMSKTEMVGKSDPKAITLAIPRVWMTMVAAVQVLPGTPAPSLREILCLNYHEINGTPGNKPKDRTGRNTGPRVVTDLIIYRPNATGDMVEVAQLADQSMRPGLAPVLQWGDVVAIRFGKKSGNAQQMPIVSCVRGLDPRTVTFKSGPWEQKIVIENTQLVGSGLSLRDHLPHGLMLVDSEQVVLRRGKESIRLGPAHDRRKILLMNGDVIEFPLKERDDPSASWSAVQLFCPDRPSFDGRMKGDVPLSEILHNSGLPGGRDFSEVEIQCHGEEGLERIPVDLLAISGKSLHDEVTVAKALELLGTTILPGDVVVFPPVEHVPWMKRCQYESPAQDSRIGPVVNLVKPVPRKTYVPRAVQPSGVRPTSSTSKTTGRRVVLPPKSRKRVRGLTSTARWRSRSRRVWRGGWPSTLRFA